ncbi:MAG: hypothetical protein A2268_07510 [Candidatus Raymondbacteria bacterium RifOxyA12_full_50_37]|uniref:Tagaturonate/fructuronate epimerase n=1 Tax=Candidatus Raymondbacteria bacterium RIFOXYD12_FULL_49_13 TaxID=1817890 RepID=A0A1F7FEJ0_UNCRA|nr:MAG: hypothetical protein A2268_07510 [Candidatus Raymondbacteria bacterium RifOxyA12_full_50_37]OGJ91228.1 MAG: hypothetical protein A2248_01655 [Candidatus Raymondbacteria bacterium RIFOXYA2_FULL_49_16]OGJ96399.1 MAG: hypothetical protein A2350_15825 [Candidatus Raymondbacteria bacterium RifOxyB12_full_50_8]OGJ97626.1 MAG: hypothetical protein A2453_02420 [Candidatus Raymondbacteria bacterium RIFOXYC2_FULL_50_21]OGK05094.1 MAG: hypothetical protein A2519_22710 [Candidatus Raymondbacteria b
MAEKQLLDIILKQGLLEKTQRQLNALKTPDNICFKDGDTRLYMNSLYTYKQRLLCIARLGVEKSLFVISPRKHPGVFPGKAMPRHGLWAQRVAFTPESCAILQELFPFTQPGPVLSLKTTFGCGDRLGLATAAHIRALRPFRASPVLAQQSMRELSLTHRTYEQVIADAAFMVFQEGYEEGWGADGDHLKNLKDIDGALTAGVTMITLDLSDSMNASAWQQDQTALTRSFAGLPASERKRLLSSYAGKPFTFGKQPVSLTPEETMRCAIIYGKAIDFVVAAEKLIRKKRGKYFDLEVSIDETANPTPHAHHLFIAKELRKRGVRFASLAPRFVGEFQKGIDYIGDLATFEREFMVHAAMAKALGGYKLSIHSGSDKFAVYPAIGKLTGLSVHVKTAGTNWLEAVRCIAETHTRLYRKMHQGALKAFAKASKLYHVTPDFSRMPDIAAMGNADLTQCLDQTDFRQVMHIAYGALLSSRGIGAEFFKTLRENEAHHYGLVEKHIRKHLKLLGVPSAR